MSILGDRPVSNKEALTGLDFSYLLGYRIIVTTVTVMEVAINEVL
jgi:hypothetical protein